MRRSLIALLFVLGLFLSVVRLAAQDSMALPSGEQGSIQGVLRDAATGLEVADAKIDLSASTGGNITSAASGSAGQFTLDSVPAGTYTITVQHPDYLPFSQQISAGGAHHIRPGACSAEETSGF